MNSATATSTRSGVRDAQIRAAVRFGRKCTFFPIDNSQVTGYVAGLDGETYLVLSVEGDEIRHRLIHTSCPTVELHRESTLEQEPEKVKKELLQIIKPFRSWIERQHSGRQSEGPRGRSNHTR